MPNPLRPGVKSWKFGSPPPRPMDPTTHPAYINQQTREAIAEKRRFERICDNSELGGEDNTIRAALEFSDVIEDQGALEYAFNLVQEKLDAGEPNTWKTYEAALSETRKDWETRPPEPVRPKTDEQKWHEGFEQIKAMKEGRLKPPRIDQED